MENYGEDYGNEKFERLMSAVIPENDPQRFLDLVQNFRLWIQYVEKDERRELMDTLKLENGDCTLRQELEEWAGLLRELNIN